MARHVTTAQARRDWAKVLRTAGLNVYDVLRHKNLVITQDAVQALAERLEA